MLQEYHITGQDKERDTSIDLLDVCPMCHNGIMPKFEHGHLVKDTTTQKAVVFVLLYCQHCKEYFICRYDFQSGINKLPTYAYPQTPEYQSFSEEIINLSPQFIKIYNQSLSAEKSGLDELAGIGYRKSLEFLVKDYLITFQHEDEIEIKKLELRRCVAKIADTKILTLAKGATWLGNDETHYVRKHEDYSIAHLKLFIDALVSLINGESTYRKALELTNNPM